MYRHDNEPNDSETSRVSHLSRIPVIAEGKQRTFRTITDENGLYNFRKLPAGEYKVRAVLPAKYIHYWSLDEVVVVASKGYGTFVEFSAGWNNSVKGRITDEAGNVVRRAVVRLLPVDSTDDRMSPNLEDVVDYLGDKGEYRITGKTPGRYILAVEVSAPFPSGPQVLRTYYSQATNRQNASIITLGETNNLELDVKLTSDQRVRWIDGVMLWSDGTPVSRNGWVFLEKLENSDDMNNFRYDLTPVDQQGRFRIQVFENAEYWVKAQVGTMGIKVSGSTQDLWDRGIRDLFSKPIKLVASETIPPLRFVIALPEGAIRPTP